MALPPSSPRLPSPPPPAEIQIGPKSPAAAGSGSLAQQKLEQEMEQTVLDANAKRRIHPGTRAADFAVGPPLVPLNELDSAFQLQEHLAALHYFHTARGTQPLTRATASLLAQAPPGTDRTLWLYELCRFLIAQCNSLIVGFLFDTPPCSAATCPEMRASEWQFLCAVHEQPKSCCAIDYCCHTLDWAANVVTNPKIFPSRFVFADAHDHNAAVKNLINVFRRLHRIFAHAWFQHRGVFWAVEGQTGLYVFFKTVSDLYDLLSAENYKLPPEAEGLVDTSAATYVPPAAPAAPVPPTVPAPPAVSSAPPPAVAAAAAAANPTTSPPANIPGLIPMAAIADRKSLSVDSEHAHAVGHTNTRRHIRSSPSTGSAVTTVLEQDEDSLSSALAPAPTAPVPAVPTIPTISAVAVAVGAPVAVGTTSASRGAEGAVPDGGTAPASETTTTDEAEDDMEATEAADGDQAPTVEHVKSVPTGNVTEPEEEGPVDQPSDVGPETVEATLPSDEDVSAAAAPPSLPPSTAATAEAGTDSETNEGVLATAEEETAAAPKVEEAVDETEAKAGAEAGAGVEAEAEAVPAAKAKPTSDESATAPTAGEEETTGSTISEADEGGSPSLVTASDEGEELPAVEAPGTEAAANTA